MTHGVVDELEVGVYSPLATCDRQMTDYDDYA